MTDVDEARGQHMPRNFTLRVHRDDRGVWIITSDEVTGLLVCRKALASALHAVPQAALDLAKAKAHGQ